MGEGDRAVSSPHASRITHHASRVPAPSRITSRITPRAGSRQFRRRSVDRKAARGGKGGMGDSNEAVLAALKQSLEQDPSNGPLWLHYAALLAQAGRPAEAVHALRGAREHVADRWDLGRRMVPLLRAAGEPAEAL